jgi:hypothetical protein
MTLENLLRIGKLKAHAADEREIARLLEAADVALQDAATAALSGDSRLELAYRALMQSALEAYRKARNQSDYRGVPVSDAVARECAGEARHLLAEVRAWIEARRPAG